MRRVKHQTHKSSDVADICFVLSLLKGFDIHISALNLFVNLLDALKCIHGVVNNISTHNCLRVGGEGGGGKLKTNFIYLGKR